MPAFNDGREVQLSMRIGVNTGPLVRGDLGSKFFRRDYTVIGDTVNRANRYETQAPHGGVLISESTYEQVAELVTTERVDDLELKGGDRPVSAYVVKSIAPPREESNDA